jgi:hypothetical protein
MSEGFARLLVKKGPNPGEEFPLTERNAIIGRASHSDIVISDAEVSRQHAEIVPQLIDPSAGQQVEYALNDLGSTNGTFVNGKRVVALTPLDHGDLIELGEAVTLIFLASAPIEEPSPVETAPPATSISPESQPPPPSHEAHPWNEYAATPEKGRDGRRWVIGCGCGCLLVVLLCMASLFFLDAYDQGRLLYCGPLQPIFELLLGPVGFSPACALP